MSPARALDDLPTAPSVVTVGFFDGVHRGHQVIIARAVEGARARGVRAVAVTFDRHPLEVVRPEAVPPALQSLEGRVAALADQGVDEVLVLAFTPEFSRMSPAAFVAEVLAGPLASVHVVIGENFRFGHRAAGDAATLARLGADHGFTVDAVRLETSGETAISSTEIREHLASGDVAWVAAALGRAFALDGEVVAGDGRGRTIGVPTANLAIDPRRAVPGDGVYAGHAHLPDGRTWPCVVNVGSRPTFGGGERSVEAHLLDADVDLYGERLTVTFEAHLRPERRFAGPDELVAQIRADIDTARARLTA